MGSNEIDAIVWRIEKILMQRHGCDAAGRFIAPLTWYINTGRASSPFLKALKEARPGLLASDLEKGGSHEDAINRVCKRINYIRY